MWLQEHEQKQRGTVGLSRAGIRARMFPPTAESDNGSSPLSSFSPPSTLAAEAPPAGLRATLGLPIGSPLQSSPAKTLAAMLRTSLKVRF